MPFSRLQAFHACHWLWTIIIRVRCWPVGKTAHSTFLVKWIWLDHASNVFFCERVCKHVKFHEMIWKLYFGCNVSKWSDCPLFPIPPKKQNVHWTLTLTLTAQKIERVKDIGFKFNMTSLELQSSQISKVFKKMYI